MNEYEKIKENLENFAFPYDRSVRGCFELDPDADGTLSDYAKKIMNYESENVFLDAFNIHKILVKKKYIKSINVIYNNPDSLKWRELPCSININIYVDNMNDTDVTEIKEIINKHCIPEIINFNYFLSRRQNELTD